MKIGLILPGGFFPGSMVAPLPWTSKPAPRKKPAPPPPDTPARRLSFALYPIARAVSLEDLALR